MYIFFDFSSSLFYESAELLLFCKNLGKTPLFRLHKDKDGNSYWGYKFEGALKVTNDWEKAVPEDNTKEKARYDIISCTRDFVQGIYNNRERVLCKSRLTEEDMKLNSSELRLALKTRLVSGYGANAENPGVNDYYFEREERKMSHEAKEFILRNIVDFFNGKPCMLPETQRSIIFRIPSPNTRSMIAIVQISFCKRVTKPLGSNCDLDCDIRYIQFVSDGAIIGIPRVTEKVYKSCKPQKKPTENAMKKEWIKKLSKCVNSKDQIKAGAEVLDEEQIQEAMRTLVDKLRGCDNEAGFGVKSSRVQKRINRVWGEKNDEN